MYTKIYILFSCFNFFQINITTTNNNNNNNINNNNNYNVCTYFSLINSMFILSLDYSY